MFKNHLVSTLRHIQRNRAFSLINLLGLSMGLSITLLVSFYVIQESSFNKGHENKDQVYRLNAKGKAFKGDERIVSILPIPAGPELKENFPEVQSFLRYRGILDQSLSYESIDFEGLKAMSFESSLFELLDLKLLLGNEKTLLKEVNSVVLSSEMAKKLFKDEDPINKLIKDKRGNTLKVTGVMSGINRTHFDFDFIIPFKDFLSTQPSFSLQWSSASIGTYIKLVPGVDIKVLEQEFSDFLNSKQNPATLERLGPKKYSLQPISDVYLKSEDIALSYGERKGDPAKVRLFTVVAIAVLLMACINFINLSTAGHVKRSKEVGLRKVIGASRKQLVFQFLVESTLMATVAGIIAILFADIMLDAFKDIIQQELFVKQYALELSIALIGIVLLTGVVAGLYPALYLSSFPSSRILTKTTRNSLFLRNGLVIIQFSIATIFIVGALVVSKQMNFLREKDIGFDIDNLMYVELGKNMAKEQVAILDKLNQSPWIAHVSWTQQALMAQKLPSFSTKWKFDEEMEMVEYMNVAPEFVQAAGMRIVAGRGFKPDEAKNHIILNETAAKRIGSGDVVGERIGFYGDSEIIGVVEDFHFKSLHTEIAPVILKVTSLKDRLSSRSNPYLLVRLSEANLIRGRESLEAILSAYTDQAGIEYGFLSGSADRFYTNESKIALALNYAAIFSIVIASLGLLGLIISAISTRIKEFGVRKVLGASLFSIGYTLSSHFILLMGVSLVLSTPIIVYTMREWLSSFSYRIELSPVEFAIGAALLLLICFSVISVRVFKAARANPIDSLRHDG